MRLMVSTLLVVSLSLLLKNVRIPKSIDLHEALPHPEKTMTAVVYDQHSADPRSLRIDHSYPQPVPGKHQVLVRVAAASLNPVDYKLRRNYAPNLLIHKPRIPGLDVSGEVVEVGSEVHGWKIGDPVAALLPALMTRWGSLADYVAIDASLLARIPSGMDVRKAASIPLVGITVLQSFARIRDNLDGKKVLIHAGAGGVGSFACQYAAKLLGMQVAVTASASKAEFLKSIGADIVVDYHTTRFEDVISGYDLIIDSMSWEYERRNLKPGVLKPTGHYVRGGLENGNSAMTLLNILYHSVYNFLRPGRIPRYHFVIVETSGREAQEAIDLVANETISFVIDREFSFSDSVAAFQYMEQGHATGKVVLYNDWLLETN